MKNKIILAQVLFMAILLSTFYSAILFAQPNMQCYHEQPIELIFDRVKKDYSPNPFHIRYGIINIGDSALRAIQSTITYNKNDLTLISPPTPNQPVIPNVINPNDTGFVEWMLRAKQRQKGDSVEICISTTYENFYETACCRKIWIPPTQSIINCKLSAPVIKTNAAKDRYIPMPFILTADVWNEGGLQSDSLFATISLTPYLQLDISEKNKTIKSVVPAKLQPNQHGTVTWNLWHPIALDSMSYRVKVNVREKKSDSTTCEIQIEIPKIPGSPILFCSHTYPKELQWNDTLGTYNPNPFTVSITLTNVGGEAADSANATIIIPPDLVLDPDTQTLKKYFNPMRIEKWYQGMPENKIEWQLRAKRIPSIEKVYTIMMRSDAVDLRGPLDHSYHEFDIRVPGVQPQITCDMNCPDSLYLDSSHTHLYPNPFTVRYVYKNIGWQPYGIREAQLFLMNAPGVNVRKGELNPITINKVIPAHDSVEGQWRCEVINSLQDRHAAIQIVAIDEEGDPVECFKDVFIPAVDSLLDVKQENQTPSSFYLGQNYPNPFTGMTNVDFGLRNETNSALITPYSALTFKVYDIFGREVLDLSDKIENGKLTIDHSQLPSQGIYFYRLTIGNQSQTRMMTMIK